MARAQAVDIGIPYRLHLRQAEQQGDVDVDALGGECLEGADAGRRGRDLDHGVGAADLGPQAACRSQRAGFVVRQGRGDFQADIAIITLAAAVLFQQQVACGLDVRHHQRLVTLLCRQCGIAFQLRQITLVAGIAADGLVENGRIGGHAGNAVFLQQSGQLAGSQQFTGQIIQPDTLAERTNGLQTIHGVVREQGSLHYGGIS